MKEVTGFREQLHVLAQLTGIDGAIETLDDNERASLRTIAAELRAPEFRGGEQVRQDVITGSMQIRAIQKMLFGDDRYQLLNSETCHAALELSALINTRMISDSEYLVRTGQCACGNDRASATVLQLVASREAAGKNTRELLGNSSDLGDVSD
ncbi:MAG: hypothetical protein AAGI24_04005 [Pseudomonadota bacterium]